jgi:hypothetical protein
MDDSYSFWPNPKITFFYFDAVYAKNDEFCFSQFGGCGYETLDS